MNKKIFIFFQSLIKLKSISSAKHEQPWKSSFILKIQVNHLDKISFITISWYKQAFFRIKKIKNFIFYKI